MPKLSSAALERLNRYRSAKGRFGEQPHPAHHSSLRAEPEARTSQLGAPLAREIEETTQELVTAARDDLSRLVLDQYPKAREITYTLGRNNEGSLLGAKDRHGNPIPLEPGPREDLTRAAANLAYAQDTRLEYLQGRETRHRIPARRPNGPEFDTAADRFSALNRLEAHVASRACADTILGAFPTATAFILEERGGKAIITRIETAGETIRSPHGRFTELETQLGDFGERSPGVKFQANPLIARYTISELVSHDSILEEAARLGFTGAP